jgi:hypothetical protein
MTFILQDVATLRAPDGLASLAYLHASQTTPERDDDSTLRHALIEHASFRVEVACLGERAHRCAWRTWVNGALTPRHGTHQEALQAALHELDLRPHLALLHLVAREPRYAGPVKDQLHSPDLFTPLYEALRDALRSARP